MIVIDGLKTVSSLFAAARAVHMTSCAVLASVFVFERIVARQYGAVPKRGWVISIALLLLMLSGVGWLATVTIDMTGLPPAEALVRDNIQRVLGTEFGHLWTLRACVLGATILAWIVISAVWPHRKSDAWLVGSILLLGSLAWAGHGRFGDRPNTHLVADVMHLLIIAIWPVGLIPLWLTLGKKIDVASLATIVNRFSRLALLSVVILIGSGWINSWMLVAEWHGLFDNPYGQVLIVKAALLLAMILLGAINLLYIRPRITRTANAAKLLRVSVAVETIAAAIILAAVGYLGLLPPPADPSTIPCCPVVEACPAASAPDNRWCDFPGTADA